MSENSNIEWTDHTFNPWIGCTKVSPGCLHCYAETLMDTRYGRVKWGAGNPRSRTSAANWKKPLQWNRAFDAATFDADADRVNIGYGYEYPSRPRVFCASLADWLDDEVPIEWLADLLKLIHETPNLDWLLLTKRPENWRKRLEMLDWETIFTTADHVAAEWLAGNPPANVWIGTTVEDQTRADERIPALVKIAARVRFLSCEPLLGPVELNGNHLFSFDDMEVTEKFRTNPATGKRQIGMRVKRGAKPLIDWIICGFESGPNRRPAVIDHAYSLRDQCAAAGVRFFMKQIDKVRSIPADLMIRQFPV